MAYRGFIAQDVQIGQHFWVVDTVDRRRARGDPGGENGLIKVQKIVGANPLIELQRDAGYLDHSAVIAQGFIKLFFARDLLGDIKLPADLGVGVKQRHLMAARGGVDGKGQTRRASADHRQIFAPRSGHYRHFGFVAGARVHQARGYFADKDLVQTGLITTDTGVDLVGSSRLRF